MTVLLDNAQLVIAANIAAPTTFLPVKPGVNRVSITYPVGVTGTITPKFTVDPSNANSLDSVRENGTAVVATGSKSFQVLGPGWIGFVAATLSGGSVTVQVSR